MFKPGPNSIIWIGNLVLKGKDEVEVEVEVGVVWQPTPGEYTG